MKNLESRLALKIRDFSIKGNIGYIKNEERAKHDNIKNVLLSKLIKEKVFWSYDSISIDTKALSDNQLIAPILKYFLLIVLGLVLFQYKIRIHT